MNDDLTGPVEHDEDGNDLPQPAEHSDLADLIQLMEYARKRGYRVGPMVRIGKLTLQIQDLRQAERVRGDPPEPEKSIWEEHGYPERE